MATIIKADSMQGAPRVLSLAELAARAQSEVLDARREAARILQEAKDRAAALTEEASRRGEADGFAKGHSDGYEAGRVAGHREAGERFLQESQPLEAMVRAAVEEIAAARQQLIQQAKSELLEVALAAAEKIVGAAALAGIEAAKANLQRVIEMAPVNGRCSVKVNPAQLEQLREQAGHLLAGLHTGGQFVLEADESVSPGGVKLVSRHGEIDATIQTQLQAVVEAMRGRKSSPVKSSRRKTADCGMYQSHKQSAEAACLGEQAL